MSPHNKQTMSNICFVCLKCCECWLHSSFDVIWVIKSGETAVMDMWAHFAIITIPNSNIEKHFHWAHADARDEKSVEWEMGNFEIFVWTTLIVSNYDFLFCCFSEGMDHGSHISEINRFVVILWVAPWALQLVQCLFSLFTARLKWLFPWNSNRFN